MPVDRRREQKLIKMLLVKRETLTSVIRCFIVFLYFVFLWNSLCTRPQQIITLLRILPKRLIGMKIRSKLINISNRYQFHGNFIFPRIFVSICSPLKKIYRLIQTLFELNKNIYIYLDLLFWKVRNRSLTSGIWSKNSAIPSWFDYKSICPRRISFEIRKDLSLSSRERSLENESVVIRTYWHRGWR